MYCCCSWFGLNYYITNNYYLLLGTTYYITVGDRGKGFADGSSTSYAGGYNGGGNGLGTTGFGGGGASDIRTGDDDDDDNNNSNSYYDYVDVIVGDAVNGKDSDYGVGVVDDSEVLKSYRVCLFSILSCLFCILSYRWILSKLSYHYCWWWWWW